MIIVKRTSAGRFSFKLNVVQREELFELIHEYIQLETTKPKGLRFNGKNYLHFLNEAVLLEFFQRHSAKLLSSFTRMETFTITQSHAVALWWLLMDKNLDIRNYPTAWSLRSQLHQKLS